MPFSPRKVQVGLEVSSRSNGVTWMSNYVGAGVTGSPALCA